MGWFNPASQPSPMRNTVFVWKNACELSKESVFDKEFIYYIQGQSMGAPFLTRGILLPNKIDKNFFYHNISYHNLNFSIIEYAKFNYYIRKVVYSPLGGEALIHRWKKPLKFSEIWYSKINTIFFMRGQSLGSKVYPLSSSSPKICFYGTIWKIGKHRSLWVQQRYYV